MGCIWGFSGAGSPSPPAALACALFLTRLVAVTGAHIVLPPPCPSTLFEGALPPLTDVLSVEGLQADLLFEDYFIRWGGRP